MSAVAAPCEVCLSAYCDGTCQRLAAGLVAPPAQAVMPLSAVPAVTHEGVRQPLDEVRSWLARFVVVLDERDHDLLTLWVTHTHFIDRLYTTPRLAVTSPLAGSGKTTVLEHLQRLALRPVQFASVTTPALLARMLANEPRTLLLDEVEKNLRPDRPGVEDLLAVLNTGYKRGGTRPTTVPDGANGWTTKELPTFSPVAMAGISPHLPDDTLARTVSVVLLPDTEGLAEDSDWEELEDEAQALAARIAEWAEHTDLPKAEVPEWVRGRAKERWRPLLRVAHAAGGDWPDRCVALMVSEREVLDHDKEEGLVATNPAVTLLTHIVQEWPPGVEFMATEALCTSLRTRHPAEWGPSMQYPQGLTVQRMGRYLGKNFKVRTVKRSDGSRAGYRYADVLWVCRRLGIPTPSQVTAGTADSTGTAGGAS